MSHVTHATAARLKAAGFPQPAFATGQIWYNQYGESSFVGRRDVLEKTGQETFFCTSVRSGRTEEFTPIHDGSFFAPTAEDILRQLPVKSILHKPFELWCCVTDVSETGKHPESAAEACAMAWLAIHEPLSEKIRRASAKWGEKDADEHIREIRGIDPPENSA